MKFELAAALLAAVLPFRSAGRHAPTHERTPAPGPRHLLAPALARTLDLPCRLVPEPAPTPPRRALHRAPALLLAPREAARRYLAWLQDMGLTGERPWTSNRHPYRREHTGPWRDVAGNGNGLWDYYLWHCEEEGLSPIPDNMLCAALDRLAKKRRVRDRTSGQMRRLTYYTIPERPEPDAGRTKQSKDVAKGHGAGAGRHLKRQARAA